MFKRFILTNSSNITQSDENTYTGNLVFNETGCGKRNNNNKTRNLCDLFFINMYMS